MVILLDDLCDYSDDVKATRVYGWRSLDGCKNNIILKSLLGRCSIKISRYFVKSIEG